MRTFRKRWQLILVLSFCTVFLTTESSSSSNLSKRNNKKNHNNNNNSFKAAIEPVGKSFIDLMKSTKSFLEFLISHQQNHIVKPIQRRINTVLTTRSNDTTGTVTTDDTDTTEVGTKEKTTSTRNNKLTLSSSSSSPFSTIAAIITNNRIVGIIGISLFVAEILDTFDVLNIDLPTLTKSQVNRVWYNDVQPKLTKIQRIVFEWLDKTVTLENLEKVPKKYNFAIGASLGMIIYPNISSLIMTIWKPTLIMYLIAEFNATLASKNQNFSIGQIFGGDDTQQNNNIAKKIVIAIESFLERLRWSVRSSIVPDNPDPTTSSSSSMMMSSGALIRTTGGGGGYYSLGSNTYHRKYLLSLIPLPQKLVEFKERTLEHPIIAMIRHGFVVGIAIGICFRL